MSESRRKRLESVILPLTDMDNFSADQARQSCAQVPARYVEQVLGRLVREGVLHRQRTDNEDRYRWITDGLDQFSAARWIDRELGRPTASRTSRLAGPREQLLHYGASRLRDADLLAILIRSGVPTQAAVAAGQRIADRFADGMEALARCSPSELRGITPAATCVSYAQIMAGIELGRRIAWIEAGRFASPSRITSTQEAIGYCRHRFARLACDSFQEQFHIVTLDTKHRPIASHRITVGTLDASLVHPREVFRPAIRDAASAVLLVHNHPSGDPTPSREDHRVTEQLTEAGKLLGIEVLDHIIVARKDCLSVRECS